MSASAFQAIGEGPGAAEPPGRSLRLLFVTSRFPYPPLKGDQLRAWHQIRILGRRHRITLVYLARGAPAAHDVLDASCEQIVAVPFGPAAMARGLLQGGPASVEHTHYLRVYLAQLRRKLEPDPAHPPACPVRRR